MRTSVTGFLIVGVLALLPQARAASPQQETFDSPQAAVDALKAAAKADDKDAYRNIFGPQVDELRSGDPVQDAAAARAFAHRLGNGARLEPAGPGRMTLLVGATEHPFAVPIVLRDGKWFFDTAAGKDEILNRRIGRNELDAISVCRGYVAAQREYYLSDPQESGLPEYAQRLVSTPGTHDGLYWRTAADEPPSPLGPLVAEARAEGYGNGEDNGNVNGGSGKVHQSRPYHGYVYKVLTRQGRSAPGGKFSYIINGHMVGGFALIAWPVNWGSSGVMTFLVGPSGQIYQKDLGKKTAEIAAGIKDFSPDDSWTPVSD